MKSPVKIYKRPRLRNPYLIAGWTDAGLVGISAIAYLIDKLGAKEFGEIEPHDFCLLPHSLIKGGVLQEIEYPRASFYYWKDKKSIADLIIFESEPPALKHYEFVNRIVDVAQLFGVERIYTVGGVYADIAHTEEPKVFAVINNPKLKGYLKKHDVELGQDYHGPTSMNGLMIGFAKHRNIDGISLWGRVPSYIGGIPNPRVCQAVLTVLTRMLGIDIDFSGIEAEAQHTDKQIEELVNYARQQNPDFNQYMGKLEKGMKVKAWEETNQIFFEEIEKFLKKQKGQRKDDSADR